LGITILLIPAPSGKSHTSTNFLEGLPKNVEAALDSCEIL